MNEEPPQCPHCGSHDIGTGFRGEDQCNQCGARIGEEFVTRSFKDWQNAQANKEE